MTDEVSLRLNRSSRVAEGVDPYGFAWKTNILQNGDTSSVSLRLPPSPTGEGFKFRPTSHPYPNKRFNGFTNPNFGKTMWREHRLTETFRPFARNNPSVHQGCSGVSVRLATIPPSSLKRWWKRGSKGGVYEFLKRSPWLAFFRLFLCRVTKK